MVCSDGFKARFYKLSEFAIPSLAWGFLGSDAKLQSLMLDFKDQIMNFILEIYNSKKVRFTTLEELSQDIMVLAKQNFGEILNNLNNPAPVRIDENSQTKKLRYRP